MATITSEEVVKQLIENDGWYPDDPQVYAIVEYTNISKARVFGITWPGDPQKHRYMMAQPPYVNNPKILWCQNKDLISSSK